MRFRLPLAGIALLAACAMPAATPRIAVSPGVSAAWTAATCFPSPAAATHDPDGDGVADGCELALAQAFAPELLADARDCLWQPVGDGGTQLGGEYLFGVQRTERTSTLRLAFAPAYYRDCGWATRAACHVRPVPCSAHAGDSELIVVDVAFDAASARWRTEAIFLSSHCFGRSARACRWYRGRELDRFAWSDARPRGRPRIWVSRGKHANYPSRAACEAGHWLQETCAERPVVRRFPVASNAQNVGSRHAPFPWRGGSDCVTAQRATPTSAGAGGTECIWIAPTFRGWQPRSVEGKSTGYARYLRDIAGF